MPRKGKEDKAWQKNDEYVKSAALAWYLHGAGKSCSFIKESDPSAEKRQAASKRRLGPSRFKLEAMEILKKNRQKKSFDGVGSFFTGTHPSEFMKEPEDEDVGGSSLFDPYEIVALSRKIETKLSLAAHPAKKSAAYGEKSLGNIFSTDNKNEDRDSRAAGGRSPRLFKRRLGPAMCSSIDVVIPGSSSKSSNHSSKNGMNKFEALVSSRKKPPHRIVYAFPPPE